MRKCPRNGYCDSVVCTMMLPCRRATQIRTESPGNITVKYSIFGAFSNLRTSAGTIKVGHIARQALVLEGGIITAGCL
jgi:hypothetical protein